MQTPAVTPPAWKGLFRRIFHWRTAVIVLAGMICFLALLLAEENWRGNRAWQQYQREMEAAGERFDIARLIPPEVPDDQNFAMTPYLAPVFDLPAEVMGQPPKLLTNMVGENQFVRLAQITHGTNIAGNLPVLRAHSRVLSNLKTLLPAGWCFGEPTDLISRAEAFQEANSSAAEPGVTNNMQAASIILDNFGPYQSTLAELHSAASRLHCRFNIPYAEWGNPHLHMAMSEHYNIIRGLYQLLALHTEAALVAGRSDKAMDDIDIMFRIDDGLKDEPILSSQSVRLTTMSILLKSIGQGLAQNRWSVERLEALQARLEKTDLIGPMVRGWHGKRDICLNQPFNRGALYPEEFNIPIAAKIFFLPGWTRLEQINLNRGFQDTVFPRIDVAGRRIDPGVNHSIDLGLEKSRPDLLGALIHHSLFANFLISEYARFAMLTAAAQSEADLAALACALERYRLTTGQYPDELNDLCPRYIAALPRDVINGNPLKYRRAANGRFILYSVGWNETDDGGTVAEIFPGVQNLREGDWVWEYSDGK